MSAVIVALAVVGLFTAWVVRKRHRASALQSKGAGNVLQVLSGPIPGRIKDRRGERL